MKNFSKLNGLGNDFVIIDGRGVDCALTGDEVRGLARRDNRTTRGCDQLLIINNKENKLFIDIYNSDGGGVSACGNGMRAIAAYLFFNDGATEAELATKGGVINTKIKSGGEDKSQPLLVEAAMPAPKFLWDEIPIAVKKDTAEIILDDALPPAFLVNVGNPHAVIFVASRAEAEAFTQKYGQALENLKLFPERANINFAAIEGGDTIALNTWERGAGATLACGTGALATALAAKARGLITTNPIIIRPPSFAASGENYLEIDLRDSTTPLLRGRVVFEFSSVLP